MTMFPPEILAIAAAIVGAAGTVIRQQSKRIDRLETRIDRLAETIAREQTERHALALAFERLRAGYNHALSLIATTVHILRENRMPNTAHIEQLASVPTAQALIDEK